jgi:hypothetical protein
MKEVYDLWVDSAESVYGQAARAGEFVQAQAELTNATSLLRTAQRELLEEWARQFIFETPTNTFNLLATMNAAANRMGAWVASQEGATPTADPAILAEVRAVPHP